MKASVTGTARKKLQAAARQRRKRARLKAGIPRMATIPVSEALIELLIDGGHLRAWDADDQIAIEGAIVALHSSLSRVTI